MYSVIEKNLSGISIPIAYFNKESDALQYIEDLKAIYDYLRKRARAFAAEKSLPFVLVLRRYCNTPTFKCVSLGFQFSEFSVKEVVEEQTDITAALEYIKNNVST